MKQIFLFILVFVIIKCSYSNEGVIVSIDESSLSKVKSCINCISVRVYSENDYPKYREYFFKDEKGNITNAIEIEEKPSEVAFARVLYNEPSFDLQIINLDVVHYTVFEIKVDNSNNLVLIGQSFLSSKKKYIEL